MKRSYLYLLVLLATMSCSKDDFLIDGTPFRELINISMKAEMETDDPDSRVNMSGLTLTWSSTDSIGFFNGPNNFNRLLTIKEGANTKQATFTGAIQKSGASYKSYYYSPYDPHIESPTSWHLVFDNQIYDGDFTENGTGNNIARYIYMQTKPTDLEIKNNNNKLPQSKFLFRSGIIRFNISSSMSNDFDIDEIDIYSPEEVFRDSYLDLEAGKYLYVPESEIGISLKETLTMRSNGESGIKYVHMAAAQSSNLDGNNNGKIYIRLYGTRDGQYGRMIVPKDHVSGKAIQPGQRLTINTGLTDNTVFETAATVGVTVEGDRFTAPEFTINDTDWQPGKTFWGDGSRERYAGGITHNYNESSTYSAIFSCWGESNTIKFSNLENITSIDFSKF